MRAVIIIIAALLCAAALILCLLIHRGLINGLHPRPRPKPGQKRVACVGDSVTYGMWVAGQPRRSYPRVLGRMLGKAFCVGNFGYSDRTASYSADKPYAAEKLYRHSLDFAPDIVLLMLGSNDTKLKNWDRQACLEGLCALIDGYRALPSHPEVMLLTPPPMFPVRGRIMWELRDGIMEKEIIPLYADIMRIKNVKVIDTHAALSDRKYFFADGVHPSAVGAEMIARTAYNAMAEYGLISPETSRQTKQDK